MYSMVILQKDLQKNSQRNIVVTILKIGLDIETRNKLKVLIQSHMSKLLMRIEEENQSINSEKSSSNIFQ